MAGTVSRTGAARICVVGVLFIVCFSFHQTWAPAAQEEESGWLLQDNGGEQGALDGRRKLLGEVHIEGSNSRSVDDCKGKEKLVKILEAAGESAPCAELPEWKEVSALYGEEPIIIGLEQCEKYRELRDELNRKKDDKLGGLRVAGLFNTGTNALEKMLMLNIPEGEKASEPWQFGFEHNRGFACDSCRYPNVAWGKHTPVRTRTSLKKTKQYGNGILDHTLPVVLVRDPLRWMQSMCKAHYSAEWVRISDHCPNLVPTKEEFVNISSDYNNGTANFLSYQVDVTRPTLFGPNYYKYESLADLWSSWYQDYIGADFPRIMIRFEDTLFHTEKVFEKLAECVGRPLSSEVTYLVEAAKRHGHSADFVGALRKSGTEEGRYNGLTADDMKYASTALKPEMMELFHYKYIPEHLYNS